MSIVAVLALVLCIVLLFKAQKKVFRCVLLVGIIYCAYVLYQNWGWML